MRAMQGISEFFRDVLQSFVSLADFLLLLLFILCLLLLPLFVEGLFLHSSRLGKWVIVTLLLIYFEVLWLFYLFVFFSRCHGVGLQCVIVAFPGHTHLLFESLNLWILQITNLAGIQVCTIYLKGFLNNSAFLRQNMLWLTLKTDGNQYKINKDIYNSMKCHRPNRCTTRKRGTEH